MVEVREGDDAAAASVRGKRFIQPFRFFDAAVLVTLQRQAMLGTEFMFALESDRAGRRTKGMDAKPETAVDPGLSPFLRFTDITDFAFQGVAGNSTAVVLYRNGAIGPVDVNVNVYGVGLDITVFAVERLSIIKRVVYILHENALRRFVALGYLIEH